MKKRHATLLEAVVALALAAGLLSLLLSSYFRASNAHIAAGEKLWPAIETHALHTRLTQLIPNTSATDPRVTSDGHSLTFHFHNEVDDDPLFSAEVVGQLALEDGYLVLRTTPSPNRWERPNLPERREILTKTNKLSFEFYEREEGWTDSWSRDELPTLIKITTDPLTFTYPVPNANKPVRYHR